MSIMSLIIFSGILSIIYGFWAGNSVLKSDAGNEKMQEISSAIQIGAQAYLNRQYTTIAIVGIVICVLLYLFFQDMWVCLLYTSPSPRDKRQSRMPSSA